MNQNRTTLTKAQAEDIAKNINNSLVIRNLFWRAFGGTELSVLPQHASWRLDTNIKSACGELAVYLPFCSESNLLEKLAYCYCSNSLEETQADLCSYLRMTGRLLLQQSPGSVLNIRMCQRPEHPALWQAGFFVEDQRRADILVQIRLAEHDIRKVVPFAVPLALHLSVQPQTSKLKSMAGKSKQRLTGEDDRPVYGALEFFNAAACSAAAEMKTGKDHVTHTDMEPHVHVDSGESLQAASCGLTFEVCQAPASGYERVHGERIFLAPNWDASDRDANGAIRLHAADVQAMETAFMVNWEMDAACLCMHRVLRRIEMFGDLKINSFDTDELMNQCFPKSLARLRQMGDFVPKPEREKWGYLLTSKVISSASERIDHDTYGQAKKLLAWTVWANNPEFMRDDMRPHLQKLLDKCLARMDAPDLPDAKTEAMDALMYAAVSPGASDKLLSNLYFLRETSEKDLLQNMSLHWFCALSSGLDACNKLAKWHGCTSVQWQMDKIARISKFEDGANFIIRTLLSPVDYETLMAIQHALHEARRAFAGTMDSGAQSNAKSLSALIEHVVCKRNIYTVLSELDKSSRNVSPDTVSEAPLAHASFAEPTSGVQAAKKSVSPSPRIRI